MREDSALLIPDGIFAAESTRQSGNAYEKYGEEYLPVLLYLQLVMLKKRPLYNCNQRL